MSRRRFPPPWSVEESETCYVRDANGQAAFNIFASLRAASIRAPGEAKLVILSQSASLQHCIALIHFRIRLRVRNTDHKTMVEKSTNDGSVIGGSCRSELRVIRLGHCHAALPTVVGPQFRKPAGRDRSH